MRWTDRLGRVVEERKIPVELTDEAEIRFPLDMRRAVAMGNERRASTSRSSGVNKRGARDQREEDAKATFIARPPGPRAGGTT